MTKSVVHERVFATRMQLWNNLIPQMQSLIKIPESQTTAEVGKDVMTNSVYINSPCMGLVIFAVLMMLGQPM